MRRAPSAVTVANEQVSIVTACRLVGVQLPGDIGLGRSAKVRCPFGEVFHRDQGVEAAMRIYVESNTAYCFNCTTRYTPVKMFAMARDLDYPTAAAYLLDHVGFKPVTLASAWAAVAQIEPEPDRAMLAEALKTYCRRVHPQWAAAQFEPAIAATLSRCLALLDLVGTEADAGNWLRRCKAVMAKAVQSDDLSRGNSPC